MADRARVIATLSRRSPPFWFSGPNRMEDARIDRQAAESAALDALTRGVVFA
jgi:hypothetical protein